MVSAFGLAALPTLAGELARRYSLHPIDLTRVDDDHHDPFADLTRLPRGRVLVGLSLLSPERMRQCLGRLNRGRDRIHALRLHVVIVIDEDDLRAVHELAPDLASRVHELLHFELEPRTPAGALVLSPLGPVRRPEPGHAHRSEATWMSSLVRLGGRADIGVGHDQLHTFAASLAWRFATSEQTWVAWLDTGRWSSERIDRWLHDVGFARLFIMLDARAEPPLTLPHDVSVAHFFAATGVMMPAQTEQSWIDLSPAPLPVVPDLEPRHRRLRHGLYVWLIHTRADAASANALADALDEFGCGVFRDELHTSLRQAAELSDAAVVLLSPAAMSSRWFHEEVALLAEVKSTNPHHTSFVVLDGVPATDIPAPLRHVHLLQKRDSPRALARSITNVLAMPHAEARQVSTSRSADELVLEFHEIPRSSNDQPAAPLSLADLRELRWYLLDYPRWPFGFDRTHARNIEAELPIWGRALHDFAAGPGTNDHDRIVVESEDLALHDWPWELLCDETGFLSTRGLCVVRRFPRLEHRSRHATNRSEVLRILLVLVRAREFPPLDPRATVEPLSEVLASLRQRAELHVLARPTFAEVAATLANADARNRPFQIVHYDGHGTIIAGGRACLAFEGEDEAHVPIERFAWELRDRRVELCLLDLHWNGVGGARPAPAHAIELLVAGVRHVVALDVPLCRRSHELFIREFYGALADGERLDRAMEISRRFLREQVPAPVVSDWFVPMLFEADAESVQLVEPRPHLPGAVQLDDRVPRRADHGFYGRYRELLELDELLSRERAVVVHGARGLGKTALVAELARWQLQMQRVHSVVWFGPKDAAAVRKTVVELEEVLRHREVLLVLDALDTWPSQNDLERLAEFPGVRLLVTSQVHPRVLGRDMHPFALEGLDDEHGVALLADLILRQSAVDELEHDRLALEELVARVGGHPATLLALAPVVAKCGLEEAAQHWLTRAVVPDLATVEQLEPELRDELVAAAAGGDMLQPPLIGHVLGADEADTMHLCLRWLDQGIAYVRGGVIFIQPQLRAALLEPLDVPTRAELERRWLSAYFWVMFAASDGTLELDRIRGLDHSLIAAVEQAIVVGYLDAEQFDDVLGRLERTIRPMASLAATRHLDELLERVDVWYSRVEQIERALERGASNEALTAAEQLLAEIDASTNNPRRRADALFLLGRALFARGRLEDALDSLQRSHQAYSSQGDYPVGVDWMIARILRSLGRLDEASESIERALEVSERAGASIELARLRADLGTVRLMQGRITEASDLLQRALELFEATGQTQFVTAVRRQLGHAFRLAGRYDEAERVFLDLLESARERSEAETEVDVGIELARIYAVSGRLAHAASKLEAAAVLAERSGLLEAQVTALIELTSVQRLLGSDEAAKLTRNRAQALYRAHRERGGHPLSDAAYHVALITLIAAQEGRNALEVVPNGFPEMPPEVRQLLVRLTAGEPIVLDAATDPLVAVEIEHLIAALDEATED